VFIPETLDIYEKKNVPKSVFAVHALRYVTLWTCAITYMRAARGKKEEIKFPAPTINFPK
jgi:hypothetical protein